MHLYNCVKAHPQLNSCREQLKCHVLWRTPASQVSSLTPTIHWLFKVLVLISQSQMIHVLFWICYFFLFLESPTPTQLSAFFIVKQMFIGKICDIYPFVSLCRSHFYSCWHCQLCFWYDTPLVDLLKCCCCTCCSSTWPTYWLIY